MSQALAVSSMVSFDLVGAKRTGAESCFPKELPLEQPASDARGPGRD